MKKINKSAKNKTSSLVKLIIYTILIVLGLFAYMLIAPDFIPSKGLGGALHGGTSKSKSVMQPSELRWSDSFKGINNMGDK